LANKQSAIKHLRSSKRKQARNQIFRGRARTAVKKARHTIDAGRLEEAREDVRAASIALDKAAQKGIIHKNNAARHKSRLMQQLNKAERVA